MSEYTVQFNWDDGEGGEFTECFKTTNRSMRRAIDECFRAFFADRKKKQRLHAHRHVEISASRDPARKKSSTE